MWDSGDQERVPLLVDWWIEIVAGCIHGLVAEVGGGLRRRHETVVVNLDNFIRVKVWVLELGGSRLGGG